MDKQLVERLLSWCKLNFIQIKPLNERVFLIDDFGKLLLLQPKNGKIISKDMLFITDEEEEKLAVEVDYLLFEFGKRFYYVKPQWVDGKFNDDGYKVDFTDLKFVGKSTVNLPLVFNNIGVHTEYEMLNGSGLKEYVSKAKFLGCTHLGLCDKNTLGGTLAFQIECEKKGIKNITGMTIDVARNYVEGQTEIPETYEIKLYVKNEEGWQNLLQINRAINVDYPKFIPEQKLFKHFQRGLVCVLNRDSDLDFSSISNLKKQLVKFIGRFENVYFQVDSVEFEDDASDIKHLHYLNNCLKHLPALGIKPVLINDCYYVDKEYFLVKDYLNKVAGVAHPYSEEQYFKNVDETVEKLLPLFPNEKKFLLLVNQMLENLNELCELCKHKIITGERFFPTYDFAPEGETNDQMFMRLISEGISEKLDLENIDEELYFQRIQKELDTINKGGLVDYLLILWDIINWCRENDIFVGPGRGSVCGSLVCYLIGITDVDPIEHNLLFERFLNEIRILPETKYEITTKDGETKLVNKEEFKKLNYKGEFRKVLKYRPDSADIDVDFESGYRDIVKEYISQRFGEFHTCSVGTYTRLKLRGGLKDFGKVRGLKFSYVNFITSNIDNQLEYTFRDFVEYAVKEKTGEMKKFFQTYPEVVHVVKFTLGQPKANSVHASAVLILPNKRDGKDVDLFNWLPIHKIDGKFVSEWEGKYTDRSGFLKEDILGLNQLDKFKNTLQLIKQNKRKKINLSKLTLDDKNTFRLFQRGFNEDVFQFNSMGLKNYSRKVMPDTFEDLVAMNALYRPGPMESNAHTDFALMKHGKKKPEFDYGLHEVTKHTQGLYIYQEQVMQAFVVLGGFTLSEADSSRTIIKKFQKEEMEKLGNKFIEGAIKNGCKGEEAKKIWNKILAFAGYGFNKSHACAYAKIAYQAQWLKTNYPLEFWTTTIQFAKEEEIPAALDEMKKLKQGVKVKPPSINESDITFKCDPDTNVIYWSLQKIKGVGISIVTKILEIRKAGRFASLKDFITRVPKKVANKRTVIAMILSGCFDAVEEVLRPRDRLKVLQKFARLREFELSEEFNNVEVINRDYFWIEKQKHLTGFGEINFEELLSKLKDKTFWQTYCTPEKFFKAKEYQDVTICGKVFSQKVISGKRGDFLILKIIHNNEILPAIIWSDVFEANMDFFSELGDKLFALYGRVRYDNKYTECNNLYSFEDTKFTLL